MTESSFTTVFSNNLEEIHMIAGDDQNLIYNVYNSTGVPLSLENANCKVFIFKYGDPSYLVANLSGSVVISGSVTNQFTVVFSGSGLSGVYQQQVRIIDAHGGMHLPGQGKIVIFPSPSLPTLRSS